MKDIFIIAHHHRDYLTEKWDGLSYVMDNPEEQADVMEYWSTINIYEAKQFYSRQEVFDYLIANPQQFNGCTLLEYTDEYLERIKGDKVALWSIRHPEHEGVPDEIRADA